MVDHPGDQPYATHPSPFSDECYVYNRTGLITAADMSMYLGEAFDESKMQQYMREVSSREDGLVSLLFRCGSAALSSRRCSAKKKKRP